MSISIIIPVYNEIENLDGTYNNLTKAIKILNINNYEIIFVNDSSKDGSLDKLYELKNKDEKINIFSNDVNLGLSQSIQKGMSLSQKEYIWWIPSDDNLKFTEIVKMLDNYNNYDFIFTKHVMERSFFRRFVSDGFTIVVNFIFNLNFPYYNSLFLIKKKNLEKINIKSKSQFWMAELSIKLLSTSNNYETRTLELNERKAGNSNIFSFVQLYKTILDLIKFRFNKL
jgi:glycosyltransferase involved in cell wall biosynthesis